MGFKFIFLGNTLWVQMLCMWDEEKKLFMYIHLVAQCTGIPRGKCIDQS